MAANNFDLNNENPNGNRFPPDERFVTAKWFGELLETVLINEPEEIPRFSSIRRKLTNQRLTNEECVECLNEFNQFPILQMGISVLYLPNVPFDVPDFLLMDWHDYFSNRTHPNWILMPCMQILLMYVQILLQYILILPLLILPSYMQILRNLAYMPEHQYLIMEFLTHQADRAAIAGGSYGDVLVNRLWKNETVYFDYAAMSYFVQRIQACCDHHQRLDLFQNFYEICCDFLLAKPQVDWVCREIYQLFRYEDAFHEFLIEFNKFLPHFYSMAMYVLNEF